MFPVSREKYNAVVAERDELLNRNVDLDTNLSEANQALIAATTRADDLALEVQQLSKQLASDPQATIQSLTEQLSEANTAISNFETRNAELETRNAELETRNAELETRIAGIEAELTQRPGIKPAGIQSNGDPDSTLNDGVDWETLNNLPHMKNA